MRIMILKETGYYQAAMAARLSRDSGALLDTSPASDTVGPKDMRLFRQLLLNDESSNGDPHAVALRIVDFWIDIVSKRAGKLPIIGCRIIPGPCKSLTTRRSGLIPSNAPGSLTCAPQVRSTGAAIITRATPPPFQGWGFGWLIAA